MPRTLGLGTAIGVDDNDSGSVFTSVSLIVSAQPPNRSRFEIEATTLGDTLRSYVFGIEDHETVSYVYYHEPNDTQHQLMRTLFAAKSQVLWQIIYASTDSETADYVIVGLNPQGITVDGLLSEEVVLRRMGAITYA